MDISEEDTAELLMSRLLSMLTLTGIDSVKLFPMKPTFRTPRQGVVDVLIPTESA